MFAGTPLYMSPEMCTHELTSPGNDLWALGVIVYQMLTGVTPFAAAEEHLVYEKIENAVYQIPEGFDPDAADLITRLFV